MKRFPKLIVTLLLLAMIIGVFAAMPVAAAEYAALRLKTAQLTVGHYTDLSMTGTIEKHSANTDYTHEIGCMIDNDNKGGYWSKAYKYAALKDNGGTTVPVILYDLANGGDPVTIAAVGMTLRHYFDCEPLHFEVQVTTAANTNTWHSVLDKKGVQWDTLSMQFNFAEEVTAYKLRILFYDIDEPDIARDNDYDKYEDLLGDETRFTLSEFDIYEKKQDGDTNSGTTKPTTPNNGQTPTTRPGIQFPTKAPGQTPTQPATKAPTKAPTQPATKAPTQPATKAPTQPATQAPTKTPVATQAPTKAPTQPATQAPTKAPNQPTAPVATKAPTQPATQAPTKAPVATQAPATTPVATQPVELTTPVETTPIEVTTPVETAPVDPSAPVDEPTVDPSAPSEEPTVDPSAPSEEPSVAPTEEPTQAPTVEATEPEATTPTTDTGAEEQPNNAWIIVVAIIAVAAIAGGAVFFIIKKKRG